MKTKICLCLLPWATLWLNVNAHADDACQSASCVAVQAASVPASAPSVPQWIDDEITRVWHQSAFNSLDDMIIVPTAPESASAPMLPAPKPKVQANVRVPAKVVALPPPKPVLTRRQHLQREIAAEQRALAAARARLVAAKKSGNVDAMAIANAQIQDRERNIAALEAESRR